MTTRNGRRNVVAMAAIYGAEPVWAATQGGGEGAWGVWTIVFLAVGGMVILFQAVPAMVLLGTMVRELFRRVPLEAREAQKNT